MKHQPTGNETEAPPGLDRHESLSWWTAWKLARAQSLTSTGVGASAFDHFIINPTKPCTACTMGTVLNEHLQSETCQVCRGLCYIPMSLEEIRAAYREIRTRVCDANPRFSEEDFHEATRQWVTKQGQGRDMPGYYLAAARAVEGQQLLERAKRRLEMRSRW